ncbi:MAG: hypothetical protein LBU64_10195, partial [Planctomycetota bacterium]|nr:hypothetical protein [Planctomycetota bacterium]
PGLALWLPAGCSRASHPPAAAAGRNAAPGTKGPPKNNLNIWNFANFQFILILNELHLKIFRGSPEFPFCRTLHLFTKLPFYGIF